MPIDNLEGLRPLDAREKQSTVDKEAKSSLLQHHLGLFNDLMKVQPQRHTEQQLKMEREKKKTLLIEGKQAELDMIRQKYQVNNSGTKGGKEIICSDADFESKRKEMIKRQRDLERKRNEEEAYLILDQGKEARRNKTFSKVKWYEKENDRTVTDSQAGQPWNYSKQRIKDNIWNKRKEIHKRQKEEIEELLPKSTADEELMLRKAIELSKLEEREAPVLTRTKTKPMESIWDLDYGYAMATVNEPQSPPYSCGYAKAVKMDGAFNRKRALTSSTVLCDTNVQQNAVLKERQGKASDYKFFESGTQRNETEEKSNTLLERTNKMLNEKQSDQKCKKMRTDFHKKGQPCGETEDWNTECDYWKVCTIPCGDPDSSSVSSDTASVDSETNENNWKGTLNQDSDDFHFPKVTFSMPKTSPLVNLSEVSISQSTASKTNPLNLQEMPKVPEKVVKHSDTILMGLKNKVEPLDDSQDRPEHFQRDQRSPENIQGTQVQTCQSQDEKNPSAPCLVTKDKGDEGSIPLSNNNPQAPSLYIHQDNRYTCEELTAETRYNDQLMDVFGLYGIHNPFQAPSSPGQIDQDVKHHSNLHGIPGTPFDMYFQFLQQAEQVTSLNCNQFYPDPQKNVTLPHEHKEGHDIAQQSGNVPPGFKVPAYKPMLQQPYDSNPNGQISGDPDLVMGNRHCDDQQRAPSSHTAISLLASSGVCPQYATDVVTVQQKMKQCYLMSATSQENKDIDHAQSHKLKSDKGNDHSSINKYPQTRVTENVVIKQEVSGPSYDRQTQLEEHADELESNYKESFVVGLTSKLDLPSENEMRLPRLPAVATQFTRKNLKALKIDPSLYTKGKQNTKPSVAKEANCGSIVKHCLTPPIFMETGDSCHGKPGSCDFQSEAEENKKIRDMISKMRQKGPSEMKPLEAGDAPRLRQF